MLRAAGGTASRALRGRVSSSSSFGVEAFGAF